MSAILLILLFQLSAEPQHNGKSSEAAKYTSQGYRGSSPFLAPAKTKNDKRKPDTAENSQYLLHDL
ncbi:hypothetical protein D3C78_1631430 [compost metagenome]